MGNLTSDDFRREALGIWDEHALSQAIDRRQWEEATIERRRPGGVMSFGIDMNPQRTRLTIGACMRYDDNTAHIELAEYRDTNQDGTMWAVNLIDKVWEQTAALVIDGQSPATALLPDLAQAGVTVTVTATPAKDYVTDGSFENAENDKNWTIAGTGASITEDSGNAADGKRALKFWASDAYSFSATQTITGLEPGEYVLTAMSKARQRTTPLLPMVWPSPPQRVARPRPMRWNSTVGLSSIPPPCLSPWVLMAQRPSPSRATCLPTHGAMWTRSHSSKRPKLR